MGIPETSYATSGDVSIAYQVMGDGPFDLILVPGIISHVEYFHELPGYTRFLHGLAGFARVITFDKRGGGMSDRITGVPTVDERMDDVRAVMDAVGSERAVVYGFSEGAALSAVFAATYPSRTQALVLQGGLIRVVSSADVPGLLSEDAFEPMVDLMVRQWGKGGMMVGFAPSRLGEHAVQERYGKAERSSCTPNGMRRLWELNRDLDVSAVLPSIRVPALVLHRLGEMVPVAVGRYFAEHIPGARFIGLEGIDHAPWSGDSDRVVAEVEQFVTGEHRERAGEDRVLATVLFTDIVGSTSRASDLGDTKWRRLLDDHDEIVHNTVDKHRGRSVKTTGDGVLATFDGPARAIRCATLLREELRPLGISIRAGLHTGEIELRGEDVGGIAVHIGQRVSALAHPDEVLVSRTVTDLVAGSGIEFEDRGEHELKGVPGTWRLFAVTG